MEIEEKIKQELKKLGLRIKKLREEKNIKIEELSLMTGIRKEYLRKIEDGTASGVRMLRHLLKISEVLNIQISKLFIFD